MLNPSFSFSFSYCSFSSVIASLTWCRSAQSRQHAKPCTRGSVRPTQLMSLTAHVHCRYSCYPLPDTVLWQAALSCRRCSHSNALNTSFAFLFSSWSMSIISVDLACNDCNSLADCTCKRPLDYTRQTSISHISTLSLYRNYPPKHHQRPCPPLASRATERL